MPRDSIGVRNALFLPSGRVFQPPAWQPSADVYCSSDTWLVKFELAGVRPEDVRLEISGARLTLHGVRRDWRREEGCNCHCMEISYSRFERSVCLPEEIRPAGVTMEYRDGMLLVRVPREVER